jgi:hypothetical protein
MSLRLDKTSIGSYGFQVVTSGNSPLTGKFSALVMDETSECSAVARVVESGEIQGEDLPSGTRMEGRSVLGDFSSVSVTSGRVLAYNKYYE